MLLTHWLAASAQRLPDKLAISSGGDGITFAALDLQSSQVAARLQRLGIERGSRVAILHENGIAPIVCFWGILKTGAQVVSVPANAGRETIATILAEARPIALVTSRRHWQTLSAEMCVQEMIPLITESTESDSEKWEHLPEITSSEKVGFCNPVVRKDDVAVVVYTSGSTGRPKGVMLSHRNLMSNILAVTQLMKLTGDDSILLVVPLHFIHGVMQLLTHALIGGTVVLSAGFLYPQRVLAELVQSRVTGFSGVPFHFATLLDKTALAKTRMTCLRYVTVTGGAMSPHSLHRLSRALPGVAIHIGYGQTEASPRICNLPPEQVLIRPTSSGVPIPGVNVEILDERGRSLPYGVVGEIVVSGPNVMRGYVSADEVACGVMDAQGRLHTGDLGRFEQDGYLYLAGRASELIKTAGERVFPRDIESVLETHPAIQETAVFGLEDELLGEKIVACAVLRPNGSVTAEELRTHCLQSLPMVRLPRDIRFSSGLPKTSTGKIDRSKLAAHFDEIGLASQSQPDSGAGSYAPCLT